MDTRHVQRLEPGEAAEKREGQTLQRVGVK